MLKVQDQLNQDARIISQHETTNSVEFKKNPLQHWWKQKVLKDNSPLIDRQTA